MKVPRGKIRAGMEKALRSLNSYKPYKLAPPYTLVLKLKDEKMVYEGAFYPGVKRTGDWELTFKSSNLMKIINAFSWLLK